ncbi:MAG: hypothetical protein IT244_07690 [Bacteroidia bacterium]|nr:hypothetical protein [Bacteroidia bacterium]
MLTKEANDLIDKLVASIEKNGIQADKNIPEIQKIREFALKENDPLVTRGLRLAWQHLEGHETFTLNYLIEDDENATAEDNLVHMLNLCRKSDNSYNRDELREMTNLLQEMP